MNGEIGPENHIYKEGDYVKLLWDAPYGWGGDTEHYDHHIKYYEGEIIKLKKDEDRQLGTLHIRPAKPNEIAKHLVSPPRFRWLACGFKRRLQIAFHRAYFYVCELIEIPCELIGLVGEKTRMPALLMFAILLAVLTYLIWLR